MPSYTSIHLAERPQDGIVAGKTFTAKQHPIPSASSLQDGEVLFQTLYASLDPAMRGWLNPTRSYIPPGTFSPHTLPPGFPKPPQRPNQPTNVTYS